MSRADLILSVELPEHAARKSIFTDTLEELARPFPKIKMLITDAHLEKLANLSDGLDGRRIRKAVISACAFDKNTALDINTLNITQLERAVSQAVRSSQGIARK